MQHPAHHRSSQPVIVAYLSGHGYGHFTRSDAVLERVAAAATVHVRTSAQALRLARRVPYFASVEEVDVGPGVAQRGPLAIDLAATRAALQQHVDRFDSLVDHEARAIERLGADLVFADVPPLAFAAAASAGVPSVALTNFTWSWIYEGYAGSDPWFARVAETLRRAEARATLALVLEMGGGLDVFPARESIPPVARLPVRGRDEVRRLACPAAWLDEDHPLVLASFGGFGAELDLRDGLSRADAYRFLVVSGPPDLAALHNARAIEPAQAGTIAARTAPTHPELVAAADCVITKPGYGTVAECLHGTTPLAHVPRGAFREYPEMVAAIARWLPSSLLPAGDLFAGRLAPAIERARASVPPETAPRPEGAAVAASRILSLLPTAPRT